MTATPQRIEHDARTENYRKSRNAERYVKGYVDKMAAWPATRIVLANSTAGLARAAA